VAHNTQLQLKTSYPRKSAESVSSAVYVVVPIVLLLLLSPLNAAAQKESVDKLLERAATLIRENRVDDAEQQLNSILKVKPNEALALNLLGTLRGSQGRLDEAETLFTRALRIDNRLVGARMNLAYLYLLKKSPEKTISELKEVLRLDPNYTEALDKLARLLLSQGQVDECIALVEGSQQPPSVASLVVLGDARLSKGDADKAEESYLRAINKQSDAADALLGLAQVSQVRGDVKNVSRYLSRGKPLVVNSPDLLYKYALVALRSEMSEEARSALEQAVKLRPDEPAYLLALGDAWLKKPDLFEAEQVFRGALQLQPASPQCQMYLGYTLLKQKKYPEARAFLEKSIKSDPSRPEPLYYLGLIAQEQNEDDRAVEIMERLVKQFPTFSSAHIALGSACMKLKNYSRARQELELAVKLDPDEPKAHYNLAILYARLKEPQRAQEEMQIVERLKNSNRQMRESEMFTPPPLSPR
jgi:Flp pilus assembly protein TadD